MTNKQQDIKYISGLLDDPSKLVDADRDKLAPMRRQYPFFTPIHYIEAAAMHKRNPFSHDMLSAVQPHTGNWILFCEYLQSVASPVANAVKPAVEEKEVFTVVAESPKIVEIVEKKEEPQQAATFERYQEEEEIKVPDAEEKEVALTIEEKAEEESERQQAHIEEVIEEAMEIIQEDSVKEEILIAPVYTEDYFLQQGIKISDDLPEDEEIEELKHQDNAAEDPKSLMVMMSFAEWLLHFKHTSEKEKEESKDQKALKTMWQKEKLAAAMQEENEEIPENVFEMAVNSITKEDDLASEPLANIYIKQGKYDKAIDMYRKLSLRNPQKSAYFANKIEEVLKEKQS
jgi:hypothetical protein